MRADFFQPEIEISAESLSHHRRSLGWFIASVIGLVISCFAWTTWSDEGPNAVAPSQESIARLTTQLGDRRFRVRESATTELWHTGRASIELLKKAAESPNREVAKRANWLLARIEYEILPDTSATLVPLIQLYRNEPAVGLK